MPSFFYRARDANGQPHEGVQVANSEEEVVRTLERAQLIPIFVASRSPERAEAGGMGAAWTRAVEAGRSRVKTVSVALFARQLATMIAAGLPVVRSLNSITRDVQDKRLAAVLTQVADSVQRGDSLSAALAKHPGAFDQVFVSLVQTGEVSGTLDHILDQTAAYLERSESLRLRVQAALRYPMMVFIIMIVVLAIMMLGVVPMFRDIYDRFRVPLPWATQVLLTSSNVLVHNILFLPLGAILLGVGWSQLLATEGGRMAFDRFRLRMPLFGSVLRMYATSKFARALGILTAAGTQILYALKVIRPVPGNRVYERAIDRVRAQVEEGSSLARALADCGIFQEMLIQMTATGEETGKLDVMLSRTADYYEQRVSVAVDGLSSLIEPITIIVLAIVVALMLLALYMPIFTLGQAMKAGLGVP